MKSYTQISGEIGEFSDLPFWKKADTVDLAYVSYGLLIVTLVVVSYLLGSFNLLPRDPQDLDLELMMAGPGTSGHLLGTDFMGRDMLSRLIVGIQAYFLPGLLAIFISLFFGTLLGVLAGYRGGQVRHGHHLFHEPCRFLSAPRAHPARDRGVQAGHLFHHDRRGHHERAGRGVAHQGQDPVPETEELHRGRHGARSCRRGRSS